MTSLCKVCGEPFDRTVGIRESREFDAIGKVKICCTEYGVSIHLIDDRE